VNWSSVWVILAYEWKMLIRDYRTMVLSVILPVLVMPLLLATMQKWQERKSGSQSQVVYSLAVVGPRAPELRAALRAVGNSGSREMPFREIRVDEQLELRLREGVLDVYLEAREPGSEPLADPSPRPKGLGDAQAQDSPQPDVPMLTIGFLGDQDRSIAARIRLEEVLKEVRRRARDKVLLKNGFPVDPQAVLTIDSQNVATDARLTGATVGPFVTVFLVFLLLGGGSVAAMDILAGERERGSMETLLTTCAGRREIVTAKQLAVLSVALLIASIQIINVLVFTHARWIRLPDTFRLELPWPQPLLLLLVVLPLAALIAAVLVFISGRSSSFKESQLLFFPAFVVTTVLALAGAIPDLSLRSVAVLVPIANVSVAVREIMLSHYDWLGVIATGLITLLWAMVLMNSTSNTLLGEGLVVRDFGEKTDDPRGRLGDRVLIWYALMAAAIMVVPSQTPLLMTLTGQILFLQGMMLVVPLGLVVHYQAPIREALALRWPHPLVWPTCLVLAPALQLAANGVFRLADQLVPIPEELVREMSRMVLPDHVPTWMLVVMIAVTPALCEEIAFRGVLLYGLSRRLRPLALTLAVGFLFGAIHLSIHRIVPTAVTGFVLTALALVTGSIFPCMLVHFGNNALAVLSARTNTPLTDFPVGIYLAAWFLVGLCFYVLWRVRTPYPGLRPWRVPRE